MTKDDDEQDGMSKQFLDDLLKEYHDLDCEDIIGGGKIKARFQYTSVPKDNYGLDTDEILLLDDKKLNKIVSMKQLRPYRNLDANGNPIEDKKQINIHKLRRIKAEFKEELEHNKKRLKESQQAHLQIEKE